MAADDELRNLLKLYGDLADQIQSMFVDAGATSQAVKDVIAQVDELKPRLRKALR